MRPPSYLPGSTKISSALSLRPIPTLPISVYLRSSQHRNPPHYAIPTSGFLHHCKVNDNFKRHAGPDKSCRLPSTRPQSNAPLSSSLSQAVIACLTLSSMVLPTDTAAPPSMKDPKHIATALRYPDSAAWASAHDACIDRNITLGAWVPITCTTDELTTLVTAMWRYKYKTKADGSLDKRPQDVQ